MKITKRTRLTVTNPDQPTRVLEVTLEPGDELHFSQQCTRCGGTGLLSHWKDGFCDCQMGRDLNTATRGSFRAPAFGDEG